MKLTPIGKIAFFLLALGFLAGGYRALKQSRSTTAIATSTGGTDSSGSGSSSSGGSGSNRSSSNGSGQTTSSGSDANGGTNNTNMGGAATVGAGELQIVTSASKRGWLNEQIDRFNAQSDVKLVPKLIETREAMQQIIGAASNPRCGVPLRSSGPTVWPK